MKQLREKGFSYGAIGKFYGISRQRVQQILSGYGRLYPNLWYYQLCKAIWARDNYTCQDCGATEKLLVHHQDGNDTNNEIGNLRTLCQSCHLAFHRPMKISKRLPRFKCLRCGHVWIPRKDEYPRCCAGCKSPYWDKEKKQEEG